jgi:hypothetical protein
MVRKFVLLKTNKEAETDEYPAYVLHYTDFSPNRKDPLSRDVVVSNSQQQIQQLYEQWKEKNIKKGWSPVTDGSNGSSPEVVVAEPESKPTKKRATKKKAAKKSTTKTASKSSDGEPPKKKRATKKRKAK